MTLRLFIVDDETPARNRMKTLLSDIAAQCPHELVGEADNGQSALDGIIETRPDIVLLDVQMPGMTGLELAVHLSKQTIGSPSIIFVSAYDEFALKAFEVHALDYLLKPARAARLAQSISRVCEMRARNQSQQPALTATVTALQAKRQNFSIQERGRLLLVPIADVLYLKAEAKYVTLRTKDREYLIEESLNSIEEELMLTFVRVHRNALVARHVICGVERAVAVLESDADQDKSQETWQVMLRGVEDRLPISRRQLSVVKALVRA